MTYKTHETLYTKTNDQANQTETCSHSVSTVIIPTGLVKTILQGTVKGGRRQGRQRKQTEEEVGRQHQGMDTPRVRQVPEGSGEQGEMEETGCEIICGAPMTLAEKG